MEKRQIPIDSQMNAILHLDRAFQVICSQDDLREYSKGFVNWHRQSAIEISVVREGALNVHVLKQQRTVVAGDGFFIMPGYLHSIRAVPGYDAARYFTVIFHPEVLYGFHGSYYEEAYYRPIADGNAPLFVFSSRNEWTKGVFGKLKWIVDNCAERWGQEPRARSAPRVRLDIQRALQDVWVLFAQHLSAEALSAPEYPVRRIYELIGYLNDHYAEKFSLTELARSVFMSRNECCRCFKQAMGMTMTEYLLEYRLSRAMELLETSALSVTDVAERTGFCDVSYFIKQFRLKTGMTPRAYARSARGESRSKIEKIAAHDIDKLLEI